MSRTTILAAVALTATIGTHDVEAQTAIPPSPQDFAAAAAQSDQYEIMAAHLAAVQGHDPHVKAFAETMIRDHTRLNGDLRQAATAAGLPPLAAGMSSDEAALLSGLQGLRGADFDKAYARQQVLAHTQAATVEDSFANAGADPALKTAARSALPNIQDHLKMAQQLSEDLGGS